MDPGNENWVLVLAMRFLRGPQPAYKLGHETTQKRTFHWREVITSGIHLSGPLIPPRVMPVLARWVGSLYRCRVSGDPGPESPAYHASKLQSSPPELHIGVGFHAYGEAPSIVAINSRS